jgi:hypothetical protein
MLHYRINVHYAFTAPAAEDRATLASDLSAVPGAKTKVGGGSSVLVLSPPSDWLETR